MDKLNYSYTFPQLALRRAVPATSQSHQFINTSEPFSAEHPEIWLGNLEWQFQIHGITSEEVRFQHVVAKLPASIRAKLSSICNKPYAMGDYHRLRCAIMDESVSDLSSSSSVDSDQSTWIVSSSSTSFYDAHSNSARREQQRQQFRQQPCGNCNNQIHLITRLCHLVAGLSRELAQLKTTVEQRIQSVTSTSGFASSSSVSSQQQQRSRQEQPRNNEQASNQRPREQQQARRPQNVCWYHSRFGAQARHCRLPCSFGTSPMAVHSNMYSVHFVSPLALPFFMSHTVCPIVAHHSPPANYH